MELKNRFGASQLVQFLNEEQGNVTCFVIPIDIQGDSATLENLTALTNFAGFLDFSDQVRGQPLEAGGSVYLTIPTTLDLTERRRHTALTTISAMANPSGVLCQGTEFSSFLAGSPKVSVCYGAFCILLQ